MVYTYLKAAYKRRFLRMYVMHKPWILTIRGLPCANHGSKLCKTIHGLSAQSVDPRYAQPRVRRNKLKGKDTIAERDCDRPRKAMLRIGI